MRYRLRTLLILLAVGSALAAIVFWEIQKYGQAVMLQRMDLWADFYIDLISAVVLAILVSVGYLFLVFMDRWGGNTTGSSRRKE